MITISEHLLAFLLAAVVFQLTACRRDPTVSLAEHEHVITDYTKRLAEANNHNESLQKDVNDLRNQTAKTEAELKLTSQKLKQLTDAESDAFLLAQNTETAGDDDASLRAFSKYLNNFPQGLHVQEGLARIKAVQERVAQRTTKRIAAGQFSFQEWNDLLANKTQDEITGLLGTPTSAREVSFSLNPPNKNVVKVGVVHVYNNASHGKPLEIFYREGQQPLLLTPRTMVEWSKVLVGHHHDYVRSLLSVPDIDDSSFFEKTTVTWVYARHCTDSDKMIVVFESGICSKIE